MDDNGSIEFEEWCTATMNKRKVLNKNRLKEAYNYLDGDGNGKVDFDEIREMFRMKGYTFEEESF
jgi:Ca2+-binding EF-hand superfamily protein